MHRDERRASGCGVRALREGPSREPVHLERLRRALHGLGGRRRTSDRPRASGALRRHGGESRKREGRRRDGAAARLSDRSQAMSERARIGFIGLGVMGGRMAATLARAGYELAVHDIDPAKASALAGAATCASPRDVAQRSDIVFTSLPLPATVRSVYLGPDGVLEGTRPGMVLADTSTVDPETNRAVCAAAAARG